MAERRPPGFNVDLGFYDSEEVLSIPRKIRAAAIGVWTLCGCYSANKLTDGYVSAEALRDRGCTPAIRQALMSTTPEPLWEGTHTGGVQFTRWSKWQRTAEEIKDYRAAEAERKRKEREAKKAAREARQQSRDAHVVVTRGSRDAHVDATWSMDEPHVAGDMGVTRRPDDATRATSTSANGKSSGWTSGGRRQGVRPEDGDPKTETETETETKRKEPPYPQERESVAPQRLPARTNNGGGLTPHQLAVELNKTERSLNAYRVAEAFSASSPVRIEADLLSGIGVQIDKCLRSGIPPTAVANGLRAWTDSTSWSPTTIPTFVHKANNGNRNGKPTEKALGYDAALTELLQEVETL